LTVLLLGAAARGEPITAGELANFAPLSLGKLKRVHVETITANLIDARYSDGHTELHLNLNSVSDANQAAAFYRSYPTKSVSQEMRVHQRKYVPEGGAPTTEACVLIRDAVNVCLALSPSTHEKDALRYLDQIDLPGLLELAVRRGAPSPFPGSLQFNADEKRWREIEDGLRPKITSQLHDCSQSGASAECKQFLAGRADCRPGRFEGGLLESDIELLPKERKNFHRLWLINCKLMGRPVAEKY
jgi:hypothetical protein